MARRVTGGRVRRWLRTRGGLGVLLGLDRRDFETLAWHAHRRLTRGENDRAEALYRAILVLRPDDLDAKLGLGACLQSKGDLVGAEAAYDEVLDGDPTHPHALTNRAEVRLLGGRIDAAIIDLNAACALPPQLLRRSGLIPRLEALRAIIDDSSRSSG